MKKIALILMAAMLLTTFTACGSKDDDSKSDSTKTTVADDNSQDADDSSKEDKPSGKKVIMVTEAGFAPYEYYSNNEVVGVDIDISKEIAKELGAELEVQNMNFDGAILAVKQGKADFMAAGMSVKPEREEFVDFSIPYATSKQVLVVNKKGNVKSEEDINKKTLVGFQTGTTGMFYAQDDIECVEKGYTKYAQAAQDLSNGKIDCIVMDELPAKILVKNFENLEILEKELFTDNYAIGVTKGNKELLNTINKVIERLISEGKIDEYTLNHTAD